MHGAGGVEADIHLLLDLGWILALYVIVWGFPSTRQIMQSRSGQMLAWRPSPQWAVVMGCAATLGLLATGGSTEFVYFRF